MLLKDKVAIVTGGTRGIGFAVVKLFLDNGAKVAMLGSRQETVDKALAKLEQANPDYPVMGLCPDLLDTSAVGEMVNAVTSRWGRVDILVNNAGISDATPFYNYDGARFDRVMDVNVKAVYHCTHAVAELMKAQGGGVILNTSSMVSLYAQASGSAYPVSKFAVNGLTKALARELGKDGIRVNAVAPGITATDMVAALDQSIIERMSAGIPLRRLGTAEDVANAFLYLASDMASYVTGAILSVDGGFVG